MNDQDLQKLNEHHNAVAAEADKMPAGLPYSMREALAELKVGELNSLVRVPESIFVRDILPALCGELGTLVDFKWWGFRFGSPYKGFLIVKDHNQSEVLFEAPPLLDRNFKLRPARSPKDTVREAAANYQNRAYSRPHQAKNEFNDALRGRLDFSETGQALKFMTMLDKIFIHYGKPSIFESITDPAVLEAVGHEKIESPATAGTVSTVYDEQAYSDDGLYD